MERSYSGCRQTCSNLTAKNTENGVVLEGNVGKKRGFWKREKRWLLRGTAGEIQTMSELIECQSMGSSSRTQEERQNTLTKVWAESLKLVEFSPDCFYFDIYKSKISIWEGDVGSLKREKMEGNRRLNGLDWKQVLNLRSFHEFQVRLVSIVLCLSPAMFSYRCGGLVLTRIGLLQSTGE
jgi:hypothetical protein